LIAVRPYCSIIVPTRDRPAQLQRCLESLARLDYPRDRFEVIVVDDGGRAPLVQVVEPFRAQLDLTLVSQERSGPAAARNAGAARARGELLAFTDDDCRVDRSWLRHFTDRFLARPEEAIGGRTVNALTSNPYSSTAQLIIDVGYERNNSGVEGRCWFATNNLAVPADGFRAIGGFDSSFRTAEDRDFCSRWIAHGLRMSYEQRAVVEHANDLALRSFVRMHFDYGRGAFRYHQKQRRLGRPVRIEPSFYLTLLHTPFARARFRRALGLEALLALWHLSNTAGFLREWGRSALRRER
jgi:glycosyltransferase involved in cell wall biosynthesis